jgi:sec-independent protein translocase protein TatA
MNLGAREIIVLLVVVLVLFGAKRLPDSARSLGRSMRIFKSEMKEMKADDKQANDEGNPEK